MSDLMYPTYSKLKTMETRRFPCFLLRCWTIQIQTKHEMSTSEGRSRTLKYLLYELLFQFSSFTKNLANVKTRTIFFSDIFPSQFFERFFRIVQMVILDNRKKSFIHFHQTKNPSPKNKQICCNHDGPLGGAKTLPRTESPKILKVP